MPENSAVANACFGVCHVSVAILLRGWRSMPVSRPLRNERLVRFVRFPARVVGACNAWVR